MRLGTVQSKHRQALAPVANSIRGATTRGAGHEEPRPPSEIPFGLESSLRAPGAGRARNSRDSQEGFGGAADRQSTRENYSTPSHPTASASPQPQWNALEDWTPQRIQRGLQATTNRTP